MSETILILNGPNLGSLGERQPEIYGTQTLEDLPAFVEDLLGEKAQSIDLDFFQSNSEGELIDRLENARKEGVSGVVFNAGAYTHTSLALADCLAWIGIPCVEVHISNILARQEEIRHQSMLSKHCIGVISGFGVKSYALGIMALLQYLRKL
ncbi:MAG: type II 3-dehydroquinate dehydratase [Thermodesulfobacteriota bacterium]